MTKCTPQYNEETRRLMARAADLRRVAKGAETGDFGDAARAKANQVIDAGETDPLKVVDAVHAFLNEHVPLAKDEVAAMIAEPKARSRSEAAARRAEVRAQIRDLEKVNAGLDTAEAERAAKAQAAAKRNLNAQIADLSRQIEANVNTARDKGRPVNSPEIQALRAKRDVLRRERDNQEPSPPATRPVDPSVAKNKAAMTRLKKQEVELTRQIETNDFTPTPKARSPFVRDPETEALQAEVNRLKAQVDKSVDLLRLKNRGPFEKGWAMFMDVFRAIILSGSATLSKLTGAAALRVVATPAEGLIGQGLKHVPYLKSRVYSRTQYEGGTWADFVEGEKQAIAHTLNSEAFKEMFSKLKGDSNLKALVGGDAYPDARQNWGNFMGTILALPARIHGVLKTPAEINDFYRALTKYSIAERKALEAKGASPAEVEAHMRDQKTVAALQLKAYIKSREAILLQDNKANDFINATIGQLRQMGDAGKIAAGTIEYELPIKKVATNIFSEATSYLAGFVKAGRKLRKVSKEAAAGEKAKAAGRELGKGERASNVLTPEEADQVARYLQKQPIGIALAIVGWLGFKAIGGMYHRGQKTKEGQPEHGEIKFGEDVTIGKQWTHTPALESLMVAADAHRAYDAAGGGLKGVGAAGYATVADVLNDLPFMQNLKAIPEAFESEQKGKAFVGNAIGSLIPPDVRKYAQEHDTETLPSGKVVHVDRQAKSILDYPKKNLPGYRETLKKRGTHP